MPRTRVVNSPIFSPLTANSSIASSIACADGTHAACIRLSPCATSPIQVQTRSNRRKRLPSFVVSPLQCLSVTSNALAHFKPPTRDVRAKVSSGVIDHLRNGAKFHFLELDGLINQKYLSFNSPDKLGQKTLVVPYDYWDVAISIRHENPFVDNFFHKKTEMKVADLYFWPRMGAGNRTFYRSCCKCRGLSTKRSDQLHWSRRLSQTTRE